MYKRKYKQGEIITSLDELSQQEFVFFCGKIYHCGWFKSWQFRTLEQYVKAGFLFKAVAVSEVKDDGQ